MMTFAERFEHIQAKLDGILESVHAVDTNVDMARTRQNCLDDRLRNLDTDVSRVRRSSAAAAWFAGMTFVTTIVMFVTILTRL